MELVIGADFLQLHIGVHQRMPVPQPYVVDGCLVSFESLEGKILFGRERFRRNLMKIVGQLGQCDVALDVRLFQLQLIWFDENALEYPWNNAGHHEGAAENEYRRRHGNRSE